MATMSKKEWGYIGGVVVVSIAILWLLYRKGNVTEITNGAGQTPDTHYLNFNIPPLNNGGLSQPQLGNVVVPPMNLNLGGCNQCYQPEFYSSPVELAAAMSGQNQPSIQEALKNLPNYMEVKIDQAYTAASVDSVNSRIVSNLGALLLPTTESNIGVSPVSTGPSGNLTTDQLNALPVSYALPV